MSTNTITKKRKKRKNIKLLKIIRYFVQIILLLLLPGIFAMIFGQIKMLVTSLINGSFSIGRDLPYITELIIALFLTALLGRFFCGWFCAFGTFNDMIFKLSGKLFKFNIKISKKLDSILKYLKYFILIFIVIVIWVAGSTFFKTASPWDAFSLFNQFLQTFSLLLPGFIILAAIIILSFFIDRAFCRYLCPLGAIFSLFSVARVMNIRKPRENCGKCTLCSAKCLMKIDLSKTDYVKNIECINCFECVNVCPKKNAHASIFRNDINSLLASFIIIIAFTGLYIFGSFLGSGVPNSPNYSLYLSSILPFDALYSQEKEEADMNLVSETTTVIETTVPTSIPNETAETQTQSPTTQSPTIQAPTTQATTTQATTTQATTTQTPTSISKYIDGTYEGVARGFKPNLKVSVKIIDGKIFSIEVISSNETRKYLSLVVKRIPNMIISTQSTEVDTISGATYSSRGIILAVVDALSKAE